MLLKIIRTIQRKYVDNLEVAELKAELKVAGKQINFAVDTAASVTVISKTQYQKTLAHVALDNTDAKLKSYCNSSIPVVGSFTWKELPKVYQT